MINNIQNFSPGNVSFKGVRRNRQNIEPAENQRSEYIPAGNDDARNFNQQDVPMTCFEYYGRSTIGKLPPVENPEDDTERGLANTGSKSVYNKYCNAHANSYSKAYDNVMPAYKTVKAFRRAISSIALVRDNSIEDFEIFRKKFSQFDDFLQCSNPLYMRHFQPYIHGSEFFGPNARIYFKQEEKTIPYSDDIYLTNVPDTITINQLSDEDDNFVSAREVYDFTNGIMYGEIDALDDGGMNVSQVNIINPSNCNLNFAKFAKIIGKPITLNNVRISENGNFKADSMVVYSYDDNNNLVSARTYLKPVVNYGGLNLHNSYNMEDFSISAKSSYDTVFNQRVNARRAFLLNPLETYDGVRIITEADNALLFLPNGLNTYYQDYSQTDGKIRYTKKQYLDLPRLD